MLLLHLLLNCVFLCLLFSISSSLRYQRNKYGKLGIPYVTENELERISKDFEPQWFDQKLDHFDPQNTETWKQRYFVREEFWNGTGPVFIQLGGEGEASPIWLMKGQVADNLATRFGGYSIYIEHRFYGQSHPTKDMSTENLRYLTSEQALADFAYFIEQYKTKNEDLAKVPWIAFGGSYSGSLAAWLRLKYPHVITGSIASSAPLLAQVNFKEYQDVVNESIGSECSKVIETAFTQIKRLLEHPLGWRRLNEMFGLCGPLDGTNDKDVQNFLSTIIDVVDEVVQYSGDNRFSWRSMTVNEMCEILTNTANGIELERFVKLSTIVWASQKCTDFKYNEMISNLKNPSWNSSEAQGGRQWTYQTCVEFGFFQTTDSKKNPFYGLLPSNFFQTMCLDVFGDKFTDDYLNKAVVATNVNYGAKKLRANRVLLPNGSLDPWHKLGVIDFNYQKSHSLFIQGTAHCADMYPTGRRDLPSLVKAREDIAKYIQFLIETFEDN